MSRHKKKVYLMVFRFVVLPYLGYRHTCLMSEASIRSLSRLRTAKDLARLFLCAGSPKPLLVTIVINTLFSSASSNMHFVLVHRRSLFIVNL